MINMDINSNHNTSKIDAYYNFYLMAYKTGIVAVNVITKWTERQGILPCYMFTGITLIFLKYGMKSWYFSTKARNISKCINFLNIWFGAIFFCASILCCSRASELFNILLCGFLLIILIFCIKKDNNSEYFLKNYEGDVYDIAEKILVYLETAMDNNNNPNNLLMLKAYAFYHTKHCPNLNCELRLYLKNHTNETLIQRNKMEKPHIIKAFREHLKEIFHCYLSQYPDKCEIRSLYILYLIKIANMRNTALEELKTMEFLNPDFKTQYIIYHYKRILKEFILSKNGDSDQFGIKSIMTYNLHYSLFEKLIVKTTELYSRFWSMLIDNVIDLCLLINTAYSIEDSIDELKSHWKKMDEIDPNSTKVFVIYTNFIKEVLNDKEQYKLLVNKIKKYENKLVSVSKKRLKAANSVDIQGISTEGDPCIAISGEDGKIGVITKYNAAFSNVFGYNTSYHVGKNIYCIMLDIFANVHQTFLVRSL